MPKQTIDIVAASRQICSALNNAAIAAILLTAANLAHAATFTVTSTADTAGATCGATCTFRQALTAANADVAAAPKIAFNIPGTGVHPISVVGSSLPTIDHANLTIDGYTQPGATVNTLAEGDNAVILIQLDGVGAGSSTSGLTLCAASTTIKGLSITRFVQRGLKIGDPSLSSVCGSGTRTADDSIIVGNFVGLKPDGMTSAGNSFGGVLLNSSPNVRIGGSAAADRNVISANGADGIDVVNPNVTGTAILGNYIGTDKSGTLDRGNNTSGIILAINSNGVTVGGAVPNRIAFNNIGIVATAASAGNDLAANDIFANNALGIDLCGANCGGNGDGTTANDLNDTDSGGNNLQNFPSLTSAVRSYTTITVQGSLDVPHTAGITAQSFSIAVYANTTCDSTGNGEGEIYLGRAPVVLFDNNALTMQTFSVNIDGAPAGAIITTTATDAGGSTSEFSACKSMTLGDGIFKNGFEASM